MRQEGEGVTELDVKFDRAATYQIKVQGRLDERWVHWFDGMSIECEPAEDGATVTILTGNVADQAALYGLISRMRDLGLALLSVERQ
jgi:hypothetical protein